jgi:hypothetical protein
MQNKNTLLSLNTFKLPNGEFKNTDDMSDEEYQRFVLAKLMNSVIEITEMSIANDRQFSRAKFEIMAAFHKALEDSKE